MQNRFSYGQKLLIMIFCQSFDFLVKKLTVFCNELLQTWPKTFTICANFFLVYSYTFWGHRTCGLRNPADIVKTGLEFPIDLPM